MEKDLVDFGHGRHFDRLYLVYHSRLYQHISENEPNVIIRRIDMPNLFAKFSEDDFDALHDFINKGNIHFQKDPQSETERTFQLMINLDMPAIINLAVQKYECLQKRILQFDIFEACLESQHPFNLLRTMLANPDWEISSFAIGKLKRFIEEEERRKRPSNKVLYIIKRKTIKHLFVLDRESGYLPQLVTINENDEWDRDIIHRNIYQWYSFDMYNLDFLMNSGLEWIVHEHNPPDTGWGTIMRYYSERETISGTSWDHQADCGYDYLKMVDQSKIPDLVYTIDRSEEPLVTALP